MPAAWLGMITPEPGSLIIQVLLGGYVILMTVGPRRAPALRRPDVTLVLDLLVIALLLIISGDLGSPFIYLYYLVILEGAVRLNLRQALAASIAAAAIIVLLGILTGHVEALMTSGFRLGVFMSGGFLLALLLSLFVQEQRVAQERARWGSLLDRRLNEATSHLKAQLEEVQFYNELASSLSGKLHMDEVMEILLKSLLAITGLGSGLAYLVGEDDNLGLVATRGIPGIQDKENADPFVSLLPSPETGASGKIATITYRPGPDLPGSAAVCVPLVHAGHLRGWVCGLYSPPLSFPESIRRRLIGLAAQGVFSLEAARLHQELQRMITTDPTQALLSWPELEQMVSEEIDRCRSLLLVFSLAGITVGEEEADASPEDIDDRELAFRHAAQLLLGLVRRVDVLAYGGAGRFAVLLPRMSKIRAVETVETLAQKLEEDSVASQLLMVERLKVSAAVVTFPEDATTAERLLGMIDELLAKTGPTSPRVQIH